MEQLEEYIDFSEVLIGRYLNGTKLRILKYLNKRKTESTLTQISDALKESCPNLAFHINGHTNKENIGLLEFGLIEKEKAQDTSNKVKIRITELGKIILKQTMQR